MICRHLEWDPYLGLPLHSCHRDAQEKDDCDGANDTDVIHLICHDGIHTLWDGTKQTENLCMERQWPGRARDATMHPRHHSINVLYCNKVPSYFIANCKYRYPISVQNRGEEKKTRACECNSGNKVREINNLTFRKLWFDFMQLTAGAMKCLRIQNDCDVPLSETKGYPLGYIRQGHGYNT